MMVLVSGQGGFTLKGETIERRLFYLRQPHRRQRDAAQLSFETLLEQGHHSRPRMLRRRSLTLLRRLRGRAHRGRGNPSFFRTASKFFCSAKQLSFLWYGRERVVSMLRFMHQSRSGLLINSIPLSLSMPKKRKWERSHYECLRRVFTRPCKRFLRL
jgi:hypothetical protein